MRSASAILLAGLVLLVLAAPASAQGEVRGTAQVTNRKMSRVMFILWQGNNFMGMKGQYGVSYGTAKWKPSYEGKIGEFKGKRVRWRFGSNAWTTFETNVPLTISGKKVEPGIYYLVLEHTAENKMNLVVLDPKSVLAKRYDAYQAQSTEGGIICPLAHETGKEVVEDFTIKFATDDADATKSTLHVHWGGHRLTAPVVASF